MRYFLPCALLLLLFAHAHSAVETGADGTKLAGEVRDIFEAKCLDCHGPELPRPKGKFGYVLDLKRVADNPEYVDRGHPENSELYQMVFNDEMPGEDANVPALTPEEKETVRRWIELGAPDAPGAAGERPPVTATAIEAQPDTEPVWKHALRWLGRFHPLSTHFPIALMFVAVLAEGLAWWTKRDSWLQTVRFLVVVAALGAIAATVLGWINAYFASYTGRLKPVLTLHRWLGTGSTLWIILCAALVVVSDCKEGSKSRQQFRGALLLGAVLVGITGFLGSALIYGLDHYSWN